MDFSILAPDIQKFIQQNIANDSTKIALQKNPFPEVEWHIILNQIANKAKAKQKLPTFFKTDNIIYPNKLSIEQTSSEKTAHYKSTLVSGNTLVDLTGGFGVDNFYFSKKMNQVIHCEINEELSYVVKHNFDQLQVKNIDYFRGDSTFFLESYTQKIDWIYLDPSRRNDSKGKVFMLQDCIPNVPVLLEFYFEKTNAILIKTAPLLDLSAGISELQNVKKIHIVAIENEVKELLWELEKGYSGEIQIKTVDLTKNGGISFDFAMPLSHKIPSFGLPEKYIYEPNAAIMKSGGFNEVAIAFEVEKLHQHSHLFTSKVLKKFPGRVFEIQRQFKYTKTDMKVYLEQKKANITTRNFPETVEQIRKKWKIKDGGDGYCFFTTNIHDEKIVLICTKITI